MKVYPINPSTLYLLICIFVDVEKAKYRSIETIATIKLNVRNFHKDNVGFSFVKRMKAERIPFFFHSSSLQLCLLHLYIYNRNFSFLRQAISLHHSLPHFHTLQSVLQMSQVFIRSPNELNRPQRSILSASLVRNGQPVAHWAQSLAYEVGKDQMTRKLVLNFNVNRRIRWKVGTWVLWKVPA